MKPRGRRSAASMQVVPTSLPGLEPKAEPPPELSRTAATLWRNIVASLPASHFGPGDLPLLAEYCRTVDNIAGCNRLIAAVGLLVDGKRNPALGIRDAEGKAMRAYSEKLRLCPSSRIRADSAKLEAPRKGRRPWEK